MIITEVQPIDSTAIRTEIALLDFAPLIESSNEPASLKQLKALKPLIDVRPPPHWGLND